MRTQPLRVGLLGCGVVGSAVATMLDEHADDLAARIGVPLELAGIAVRRPDKPRGLAVDRSLYTTDAAGLVARDDVDLVVEVIGGLEPARSLIHAALSRGKPVVTANKALLASDGAMLHDAAAAAGVDLYFEASVGGGIPLLRALKESLAGDRLRRVLGIVNGTTNFVLTRMEETGSSLEDALAEATALGYAEADPTADVEGYDAAAKAAILASIAFHTRVPLDAVHREGIANVTAADVARAKAIGRVVKLLAICERTDSGIVVRVHPAMIPATHPLARVRDAFNAVFVEGHAVGELMFYGRGAGGAPTASAVVGDLVTIARDVVSGSRGTGESAYAALPVRSIDDTPTRFHMALDVVDRPGVLAAVTGTFSAQGVSIATLRQDGRGDEAQLVLVTHAAPNADLDKTVEALRALDVVRAVVGVMRVEGD